MIFPAPLTSTQLGDEEVLLGQGNNNYIVGCGGAFPSSLDGLQSVGIRSLGRW